MAFKLKHQNTSPFKQRFVSSGGTTDEISMMNQMLSERAAASGITPKDHSNETISTPTKDDSLIKQVGTLLSNPFDGVRSLVNQTRGGIRESLGMSDEGDRSGVYGSLTNLSRANDSTDPDTIKELERGKALNVASQIGALASGAVLTGQTLADLAQGDPAAAALKGAKKFKPIYKLAKNAYMGLKAGKVLKKNI
jgi:hypothetical protein